MEEDRVAVECIVNTNMFEAGKRNGAAGAAQAGEK